MTETRELPVLPLTDDVVLPGMVAPIALDAEAQAAVDAARSAADGELVLVPRVNGAYNADGVVATIEQVGRLPNGEPAAALRGLRRARSALVSPELARRCGYRSLWSTRRRRPITRASWPLRTRQLPCRSCNTAARGSSSTTSRRSVDPSTLSDTAGYASYLDVDKKLWLLGNSERR